MHSLDLYDFRQKIIENKIILSFEGKMSQGVLTALIDALREKVTASNGDSPSSVEYTIRKICSILVELAQNIQNHSLEQSSDCHGSSGLGIIVIREDENTYTLTSGNNLRTVDAQNLAAYCSQLNSLDEVGLKTLFKEKLRRVRAKDEKGGGIGLVEIKRKSNHPLVYVMQPVDDETMFFSLSVSLIKVA